MSKLKAGDCERVVTLVMEDCCGCGCWDVKVERVVNADSPLKDGDRIEKNSTLEGDNVIN